MLKNTNRFMLNWHNPVANDIYKRAKWWLLQTLFCPHIAAGSTRTSVGKPKIDANPTWIFNYCNPTVERSRSTETATEMSRKSSIPPKKREVCWMHWKRTFYADYLLQFYDMLKSFHIFSYWIHKSWKFSSSFFILSRGGIASLYYCKLVMRWN